MDPNAHPEGFEQSLAPVQVIEERPRRPPRRRTRFWGVLFILLLALGLGASVLLNISFFAAGVALDSDRRVREKLFSHERFGAQKVAIISVEGVLLGEDEGFIKRQIDQASEDEDVRAVVLRIDSPGGSVGGSHYLYHHLDRLRKERRIPLVVSMGGIAASGGYYVSMAVGGTPDTIFAEPTTWTGSIGVMIPHYDASELAQELGVKNDTIVSHPLKNMGSFTRPMTEEERQIWQVLVDEAFERFKDVVKQGRPKFQEDPDALDRLATGQVYAAEQALEHGLIDKIGFLEDAVQRAIELARLDEDDVRVVKYRREPNLADILLGVRAPSRGLDLASLFDMAVPRAYYLYSRIPPLVCSGR